MKNLINTIIGILSIVFLLALIFVPDLVLPSGLSFGAIAVYTKVCAKNVSGNTALYWCEISNITSFTITAGEISTVTVATGKKFLKADAEIDTIDRTEVETGTGSNLSIKHTVMAKFNKPSTALNTLRNSLADASPCGIYAIVTDGNGTSWLVGYNATDTNKRPLRLISGTVNSGLTPADAEGNRYSITLETDNGYVCLPFDATNNGTIKGGTAAFITYA